MSWNQLASRRGYLISIFPLPFNIILSALIIAYLALSSSEQWDPALAILTLSVPLFLATIVLYTLVNVQVDRTIVLNRLLFASNLGIGLYAIEALLFSMFGFADRRIAQALLSIFTGSALCFLIIRSVCFTRNVTSIGFTAAAVSPAVMHFTAYATGSIQRLGEPTLVMYGAAVLASASFALIVTAVHRVIKRGRAIIGTDPTAVLSSLLEAWRARDVRPMELWLEKKQTQTVVKSHILRFVSINEGKLAAVWVILGVHPGPFNPLGSYRITEDLHRYLKEYFGDIPIFIFHGPSNHDLDLISNKETQRFVSSFRDDCRRLKVNGLRESSFYISSNDDAFPLVACFNRDALVIFTGRAGDAETDDIEPEFAEILRQAISRDDSSCIIIDAHNGITSIHNTYDSPVQSLIRIASGLTAGPLESLRAGFFEIKKEELGHIREVGGAGLSFAYLKAGAKEVGIVLSDSNNFNHSCLRLLTEICEREVGHRIVFCTTDSHVTANHVTSRHAYLRLGDITRPAELANYVSHGLLMAKMRSEDVYVEIDEWRSNVAVFGKGLLSTIAYLVAYAQRTTSRLLLSSLFLHLAGLLLLIF